MFAHEQTLLLLHRGSFVFPLELRCSFGGAFFVLRMSSVTCE
jgi:hypothetical protein